MQRFIYLSESHAFLAAQWFCEHRDAAPVCLLHAPGMEYEAQALSQSHACIDAIIPLDQAAQYLATQQEKQSQEAGRILWPIMPDEFPLRYQFPLRVPDFRPHALLLQRFWTLGFREVEIYHPGGSRTLSLPHVLHAFADCHRGRRCFIIGNGPSLNRIDMRLLRNEITFASNRGYLGFGEWGFSSTYWGIYDPLQIEKYGDEYERQVPDSIIKFLPLQYWSYLRLHNACPVFLDWPRERSRQFSDQPDRLFVGYSVTYMLMQIAALMGCNPIILVGMDHRYNLKASPGVMRLLRLGGRWLARRYDNRTWYRCGLAAWREYLKQEGASLATPSSRLWKQSDAEAPTHFDERYTSERREFLLPRPADAEADYRCALAWMKVQGRTVLNATPDSALDVFPKIRFEELF